MVVPWSSCHCPSCKWSWRVIAHDAEDFHHCHILSQSLQWPWSACYWASLKGSGMVIIATRNDCSSGYRKFAHSCKKSEAAENKRHGPKLPLLCLGFVLKFRFRCLHSSAPYLRLIWLHLNHRRAITTQLYVVLTACPFLQLFNGQIIAQLSRRFQRGRLYLFSFIVLSRPKCGDGGICKIVALQFYSWHVP